MASIRELATQYYALTGESAYMGKTQGAYHVFVDGNVKGDDAAQEHMTRLLDNARRLTPALHVWEHRPDGVHLVNYEGQTVRHVDATEHPWRES